MRKVVILTLVTLFTCVEYSQAQTTEKEMTRQEKKAAQEALDKMLFQEAKEAIDNQTFVLEADRVYFKYGTSAFVSSNTNFVGLDGDKAVCRTKVRNPNSYPCRQQARMVSASSRYRFRWRLLFRIPQ